MACYISNTKEQQNAMLSDMGVDSMGCLFKDIPEKVRLNRALDIPSDMSEMELIRHMRDLSAKNYDLEDYTCFLGAGAYDHYIPSAIGQIVSRQEFYTAYTPYQPEISQGTLQAIFEFQSMICELTGMEVANASMYDGSTALAEAMFMSCSHTRRGEVLVAKTVHPESREVLKTYTRFKRLKAKEIGYENGRLDLCELEAQLNGDTAAVIVQSPNFFGIIEDLKKAAELAHRNKSLLIVSADPISLILLKSPGEAGADIVVGEGQALGNPLSFGGPYLGFLATTKQLMRRMPGRLVGETVDSDGKRGFVLTIQTREQHIRREKATSNICSNQALNALTATVYMTLLGKQGMKEVAELCLQKSHYLYQQLIGSGKFEPINTSPFFKEFAVRSKCPVDTINNELLKAKIIGGYSLEKDYPELQGGWLLAVTEKRTRQEMDGFVKKVVDYCG
jgi:Glycine cleavage system protein P (pyridoxal-binding), N-terminal domain